MNSGRILSLLGAMVVVGAGAPLAYAGDHGRSYGAARDHRDYPGAYARYGYRNDRRSDDRSNHSDLARVLHVEPITRRVRISEPYRDCWQETRYDEPRDYRSERYAHGGHSAAGQMIVGSLIGGALGNQIGSGDGRRAATVAGALIGSAIGHDVAARRALPRRHADAGDRYYDGGSRTIERCETRYEDRWDERVEGYWVTYEYYGREFRSRLPYDPGRNVRVNVDVWPDRR